jgi:hypothetical protein
VLAYDLSLVDFEALQEAGPSATTAASASASGTGAVSTAAAAGAAGR